MISINMLSTTKIKDSFHHMTRASSYFCYFHRKTYHRFLVIGYGKGMCDFIG